MFPSQVGEPTIDKIFSPYKSKKYARVVLFFFIISMQYFFFTKRLEFDTDMRSDFPLGETSSEDI